MKLLIVSRYFEPQMAVAAKRPTNFARYLAEMGHEVTILTEENGHPITLPGVTIHYVALRRKWLQKILDKARQRVKSRAYSAPISKENKGVPQKQSAKSKVIMVGRQFAMEMSDNDWNRQAKKLLRATCQKDSFDIVLTTFAPAGMVTMGSWIVRQGFARRWICDLRDPIHNPKAMDWVNHRNRKFEEIACAEADCITMVSQGATEMLAMTTGDLPRCPRVEVIYNGYDPSTFQQPQPPKTENILRICYTGLLYFGDSNAEMLFEAIAELEQSGAVPPRSILVDYAGNTGRQMVSQAELMHCGENVTDHGMLPRSEAIRLQQQSDILLLLSWNTETYRGALSGKFAEYLAAGKPILALISGTVPGGELTELIRQMGVGEAYEYCLGDGEKERMKTFLLAAYQNKCQGKQITYAPVRQAVEQFSYEAIIKKLEQLCEELL